MRWTLACVLVPAVLWLAAAPFGEYMVNDDWQMHWSAFHFAKTGEIRNLDYSAMGLAGWTVLGGSVVAVVGESLTLLRLLGLAALALTGWLAYRTAREWGLTERRACFVSLLVTTCPVLFWLSTSFQTDAPWHAAWVAAIWAWSRGLRTGSGRHFVIGTIAVIWASWVRIPVIALPLALLPIAVLTGREAVVRKRALASAVVAILLGPVAFMVWYHGVHGATSAYVTKATWDVGDALRRLPGGLFATVAYLGFFAAPVSFLILRKHHRAALVAFTAMFVFALTHAKWGFLFGISKSMPYLPNVAYNLGMGPMTLTDVIREGGAPPFRVPGIVQVVAGALFAANGAALSVLIVARGVKGCLSRDRGPTVLVGGATILYLGAAVLFTKQSAPLFDRYLVPMLLPAALILLRPGKNRLLRPGKDVPSSPGISARGGGVALAVVALFACAGGRDYHRFAEARVRLTDAALATGATHRTIDVGFEHNGFHNYEAVRRGEFTPPDTWNGWWVDPEFVVAKRERHGYEVVDREPVTYLIGAKTWDLLLLRRLRR